ncbi:hypothetical protein [Mucilaginibacter gotjawali]|uniref:Uncharacterized protein n=2 Tax=Mucilaginibacter gotjawali TaxID=1550579 RepID=A0A110B0A5_9SPHI|nr:hypothetical protein [Mucilaginibacter gotjawali]MBB3057868.1 uncharacterized protein YcnI [Mucilaginibacter gotjawali]BAU52360.1 hypothetical protein MgSA37_00515 [Mucilaginibacter gotjawali]
MKKLFTVLMLSAFTFGTFAATAHTAMQQDTSKHKKSKSDTTKKPMKKDSTKHS